MDTETNAHSVDTIAHAVLNSMSAISGRAQLIRRHLRKNDFVDRHRLTAELTAIEEEIVHASSLIEACRGAAQAHLVERNGHFRS